VISPLFPEIATNDIHTHEWFLWPATDVFSPGGIQDAFSESKPVRILYRDGMGLDGYLLFEPNINQVSSYERMLASAARTFSL
jgi:hypothetical protein